MNALYKKAYLQATATEEGIKQVIMLYDGAITALMQVKQAIADKDIQTRFNKLEKAFKIVSGLRDALDFSQGEEISKTLAEWYDGVALRIISINKSESFEMCDLCIANLKEMRNTWAEADLITKGQAEGPDDSALIITKTPPHANVSSFAGFNLEI